LLAPLAGVVHEPADGKGARAPLWDLDRYLVVGTPDAAALDLQHRRDRLHRLLEHLDRRLAGLLADPVERAVDAVLRGRLLAARHHLVDHLRDEWRVVDGVRLDRPGLDFGTAGHYDPRLAP